MKFIDCESCKKRRERADKLLKRANESLRNAITFLQEAKRQQIKAEEEEEIILENKDIDDE